MITARKIRQPIESNDITNAFDGITYGKGAAILAMFETWIGTDSFRAGIQRYLAKHAWGNATVDEFLGAIHAAAGRAAAPAFKSFLDQTGVPLVTVELSAFSSTFH
ncbi:MAG: hypothetical protein HYR55_16390 [Acidobacteria bacterium]|nr:hypothetical protein [Acidobacteriota bacterium]MBI3658133.1 hypothetical protein [Acidobacteriota bacterium]